MEERGLSSSITTQMNSLQHNLLVFSLSLLQKCQTPTQASWSLCNPPLTHTAMLACFCVKEPPNYLPTHNISHFLSAQRWEKEAEHRDRDSDFNSLEIILIAPISVVNTACLHFLPTCPPCIVCHEELVFFFSFCLLGFSFCFFDFWGWLLNAVLLTELNLCCLTIFVPKILDDTPPEQLNWWETFTYGDLLVLFFLKRLCCRSAEVCLTIITCLCTSKRKAP